MLHTAGLCLRGADHAGVDEGRLGAAVCRE